MTLIEGWRRLQGMVLRPDDRRFDGIASAADAVRMALSDPELLMVNRNTGAGTRTLIDRLLAGARPAGYWNQPRSHNAVAAAVAQRRADWGVAIRPVAEALGLRFLPLTEEHYDFAVAATPKHPDRIAAFREALAASADALRALGFTPVSQQS
jgi:putative molybdopterin biosynthesis protein